jgi:hypothetical protein
MAVISYYLNLNTELSLDTKAIIHSIFMISIIIIYYLDDIASKLNNKN